MLRLLAALSSEEIGWLMSMGKVLFGTTLILGGCVGVVVGHPAFFILTLLGLFLAHAWNAEEEQDGGSADTSSDAGGSIVRATVCCLAGFLSGFRSWK